MRKKGLCSPHASAVLLRVSRISGPTFGRRHAPRSRTIPANPADSLSSLHRALFREFGHEDEERLYVFCFGESWRELEGPCYSEVENNRPPQPNEPPTWIGDARQTSLKQLGLRPGQKFTYWFDFGADWIYSIEVIKGRALTRESRA